ncbi:alpha/beta hydrolase [Hamadaea tsunoensis]|uniref:alpha/beta hydrolase n=1 Tax=Hamadaea tsunoensis TaxID=53368 RepID=UPI00041DF38C|nr:alpha/beta hydrolase [Hamadaea tsunoensis]
MRVRRMLILAMAALLSAACFLPRGLGGGEGAAPAATQDGMWTPCSDVAQEVYPHVSKSFQFHCAKIDVPADWSKPDGEKIQISLIRARVGSQKDRIGSLLVNPGGPGGSGVDTAVYLTNALPLDVLRRFDLIGFDPRGVGRSTPIKCMSDSDLDKQFGYDPDPVSQELFDGLVSLTRKIDDGCHAKYGDKLKNFGTVQAAKDMDAIRQAVGDDKLNYLGYSYGTLLGATYAQLFPTKIRAMVLDGAVDPTQTSVESGESQAKGFERAFTNFTDWCKGHTSSCPIAPDARSVITQQIDKARTNPVDEKGRLATSGWVFYSVISALYTKERWSDLADAIDALRDGDASRVFDLADEYAERSPDGTYSNLFDANAAVNCTDDPHPPTVDQVRDLQSQWRGKYPMFGAPLAVGSLTCSLWQGGHDPVPTGKAVGAPPIVVVGTKGDPATPYEQTAVLANMLGVGHVLTWEGEGHTAYPATRCISDAVNSYLIDLKVPAEGKTCPA